MRPFVAALAFALLPSAALAQDPGTAPLRFSVTEGRVQNEFFRDGSVAAHLVLTSGTEPRLVVAFPAGNSGTALWFDAPAGRLDWLPATDIAPVHRNSVAGTLRGISAELAATGAPVTVRHAILSSVRVIRDYGYTGETPREVMTAPRVSGNTISWERRRLDGEPGYFLSLEVLEGSVAGGAERPIEVAPGPDNRLRLRVTALTGDEPLVPIPARELLAGAASADAQLRRTLAFLSYDGKLLAGSWRFNTYFGRDTLMSLALLMPVLEPRPLEAGLAAVLERLNADGEVAHEEDIGEYAVLRHLRRDGEPRDAPLYDYKMIDDDFMLPIIAARYLLENPHGRERGAAFLARRTASGEPYGSALVRNFGFVLRAALPFAEDPQWRNMVALKPGEAAGNWRDSDEGLGGGRIPYDVNGVFVPAALAAIARFDESGILDTYLASGNDIDISGAGRMAGIWERRAPPHFDVTLPAGSARAEVAGYAARIGVRPGRALGELGNGPVTFRAVALDEAGVPVPVLNTDEAFALLFLDLDPQQAARIAATLSRPFPAGLMTDIGPVVANPAYADDELEARFDSSRYHGTVIWSWQQAMFAAGISRQLARTDLTAPARAALDRARGTLEAAIARSHGMRGSELWSWSENDGVYSVEPFGQRTGDVTESNAAQLWSTVYLAPLSAVGATGERQPAIP